MPAEERDLLAPQLGTVPLRFREDLYDANGRIDHVWFVHRGVVSMIATPDGGADLEFATIGPEGLVGIPIFPGAGRMASKAFVQVPGEAARMEAERSAARSGATRSR